MGKNSSSKKRCFYHFSCGCKVPADKVRYLKRGEMKQIRAKGITDPGLNMCILFCHTHGGRLVSVDKICRGCGQIFKAGSGAAQYCPDCADKYYAQRKLDRKKPIVAQKKIMVKCPRCGIERKAPGPRYQYCKACKQYVEDLEHYVSPADRTPKFDDLLYIPLSELRAFKGLAA